MLFKVKLSESKTGIIIVGSLFGIIFGCAVYVDYTFKHMTPAQHLYEARRGMTGNNNDVNEALQHIAAIPAESPDAADAKALGELLRARKAAINEAIESEKSARQNQRAAIEQLQSDLKGLGYDLKSPNPRFRARSLSHQKNLVTATTAFDSSHSCEVRSRQSLNRI